MIVATAGICVIAAAAALNVPTFDPPPWLFVMGTALLPVLVFGVRSLPTPLFHGLDLANDVARYFRGRSWASTARHRTDKLLKARLRSVVDDLLSNAGPGRLVIVAHSQGTVIAADALRNWRNTSRVDLVTMGSPLLDLYARFFGLSFCTLIPNVRTRARSWVNLYRADDYVGRRLDHGVTDIAIEGTGHEGYWTDARVLAQIESLIGLQVPTP